MESQSVFQAETRAKFFSIESPPRASFLDHAVVVAVAQAAVIFALILGMGVSFYK